jgi:hypothetical protein
MKVSIRRKTQQVLPEAVLPAPGVSIIKNPQQAVAEAVIK